MTRGEHASLFTPRAKLHVVVSMIRRDCVHCRPLGNDLLNGNMWHFPFSENAMQPLPVVVSDKY